jgi:hypothetical protein
VRFRNDTGSVLTVNDLGVKLGPDEVLDWPGWSRKVHGVIPGCSLLDPEPGTEDDSDGKKDDDPPPGGTGTGTPPETGTGTDPEAGTSAEETEK